MVQIIPPGSIFIQLVCGSCCLRCRWRRTLRGRAAAPPPPPRHRRHVQGSAAQARPAGPDAPPPLQSSLFFLLSGFFGDLLLIRLCLLLAYCWLLVAAATGFPTWPHALNAGWIGLDGIIWWGAGAGWEAGWGAAACKRQAAGRRAEGCRSARPGRRARCAHAATAPARIRRRRAALNILVHGQAAARLLWDERPVRFGSELQERVWRFFLRRSGMGRLEFLEARRCARWAPRGWGGGGMGREGHQLQGQGQHSTTAA